MPHGAAATVAILALPVRYRIGVRARGGKSQLAIFWFHFVWLDLLPSPSPPKIARICMHDPRVRDSYSVNELKPMEDNEESRSLATVQPSPVYSESSTDSVEVAWPMTNTQHAAEIKYQAARALLTDVSSVMGGCVQLLLDHLPHVVHMAASDRNKNLIKPCATATASHALRATTLPPTAEIARLQRNQVSRLAEAMRKDAQRVVRVKLAVWYDSSVRMSIESSPFGNAFKYKDTRMATHYADCDVLRSRSSRPILCYLYHHLECMDVLLESKLADFDRHVEFYVPNDSEHETYFELLALFNSALLLKLTAILRSCVTMYFHTTHDSNDCDGHAQCLRHLIATIQNRSMRTKARSCDTRFVDVESDIFEGGRAAKRPRYDDGSPEFCEYTDNPRDAARYYATCVRRCHFFTDEMARFLEDLSP